MSEQNPATAGKPEVSPEQDFASYEKTQLAELMGDPAPAEEEKQPAVKAETPEPEPAPESDPDEEDQEKRPHSKREQKRFDTLTREKYELRAEIDQLRKQLESKPGVVPDAVEKPKAAEGKPTPPDPNTWKGTWDELETAKIDYLEQLADWKVEQREKAREDAENQRKAAETQKQRNETWAEKVKALKEVHPDYEDVLGSVNTINIAPALEEAIRTSEHGPAIVYHLASNPDEALRIAALPAVAGVRELGKLEAQFVQQSTPETPKSRVSKAPTPPKPVKGTGGSVSRIDGDIPFSEYEPLRMAQERRR